MKKTVFDFTEIETNMPFTNYSYLTWIKQSSSNIKCLSASIAKNHNLFETISWPPYDFNNHWSEIQSIDLMLTNHKVDLFISPSYKVLPNIKSILVEPYLSHSLEYGNHFDTSTGQLIMKLGYETSYGVFKLCGGRSDSLNFLSFIQKDNIQHLKYIKVMNLGDFDLRKVRKQKFIYIPHVLLSDHLERIDAAHIPFFKIAKKRNITFIFSDKILIEPQGKLSYYGDLSNLLKNVCQSNPSNFLGAIALQNDRESYFTKLTFNNSNLRIVSSDIPTGFITESEINRLIDDLINPADLLINEQEVQTNPFSELQNTCFDDKSKSRNNDAYRKEISLFRNWFT